MRLEMQPMLPDRKWCAAIVSGVLLVAWTGVALLDRGVAGPEANALAAAAAANVEDFMLVIHGPKGLRTQIQEALAGSGPADAKAWRAVKARAAVIVFLTESILVKSQPEKGDKASWKEKVGEYTGLIRELAKATAAKDVDTSRKTVAKISKGCQSCHKAHK